MTPWPGPSPLCLTSLQTGRPGASKAGGWDATHSAPDRKQSGGSIPVNDDAREVQEPPVESSTAAPPSLTERS